MKTDSAEQELAVLRAALAVLVKARAILADDGWTQGAFHREDPI